MKAFISPAVAPEACEYSFFPLLYFSLTEGSQVLWVTKPLHSESHHSSFFLLDCLLFWSPLYSMNKYSRWVYEGSLWRQAWWMLGDSASKRLLWCEHLSCGSLLRLQTLFCAPLPSSSSNIAIQPLPGIKDQRSLRRGANYCHTLPINPFILFCIRISLWRPDLYPCPSNLICLPLSFRSPHQEK